MATPTPTPSTCSGACACHSVSGGGGIRKMSSSQTELRPQAQVLLRKLTSMLHSSLPRLPEELGPEQWVEKAASIFCCCRGCIAPSFNNGYMWSSSWWFLTAQETTQGWVQCLRVARMTLDYFLVPLGVHCKKLE